jgi:hypothetical protein
VIVYWQPSALPQLAAKALSCLWQLPWSTAADFSLAASKPAGLSKPFRSDVSMEKLILHSHWFNYYEKLMLWRIWDKACSALKRLAQAQQGAQQPGTAQPGTHQLGTLQPPTQQDVEWVSMLAADFFARVEPEQRREQEQIRQRLNWHEWCANRLWELHNAVQPVQPASFTDRASLLHALQLDVSKRTSYSE